jgi:probable phosphoglycerate mutase
MTTLYLIRHAENDYVGKRLAGCLPDIHLNQRGRAQAEELAKALASIHFEAIYASPLERAQETAEPIARVQNLKVILRPGLGEVDIGSWEGKSLKALRRRKLWAVLQSMPSLFQFPEGESIRQAQARITAELEALRAMHKGSKAILACIFHADPIKLALAHYMGLPLDMYQRLTVSPASISVLRVHDGQAKLLHLNQHLVSGVDTHE